MEGFTVTYKEQSVMDRAASQQDAAAARALIKEELVQQKEIAQGCKRCSTLDAPQRVCLETL
eukprot:1310841-Pleurochrysis_carterae.AAC.2